MQSNSRRERRIMAKKLGFLGKDESYQNMLERTRRSSEYGRAIHLQNLTAQKNSGKNK
jgi:hypothetical protein